MRKILLGSTRKPPVKKNHGDRLPVVWINKGFKEKTTGLECTVVGDVIRVA